MVAAAKELEDHYYGLKAMLDQFEKEKSKHWGDPILPSTLRMSIAGESSLEFWFQKM